VVDIVDVVEVMEMDVEGAGFVVNDAAVEMWKRLGRYHNGELAHDQAIKVKRHGFERQLIRKQ
jgi:predicted RNA polymerase sigma factor